MHSSPILLACASYRPWECKTWPLLSSSPCAPPVPLDAASERLLLLSCMCHAAVVCACSAVGVQGPENCRRLLRSLRGSGGPKAGLWALGRPGCLLAQEATGAFAHVRILCRLRYGGRLRKGVLSLPQERSRLQKALVRIGPSAFAGRHPVAVGYKGFLCGALCPVLFDAGLHTTWFSHR